MFSRIAPLVLLVTIPILWSCSDAPTLTTPPSRLPDTLTPPAATVLLVSVAGPTVLNTGNASDFTNPLGMNAVGDAVAGVLKFNNEFRVLRWPSASAIGIDIGTANATARAINVSGQIGGAVDQQGTLYKKATLWTPLGHGTYQLTDVAAQLAFLANDSEVMAINDYGQVVGRFHSPKLGQKCFLWTPTSANATTGKLTSIPGLGGSICYAYGINSAGNVVGVSSTQDGSWHAFLWSPGTPNGAMGVTQKLAPTCSGSSARAINDALQIAGECTTWGGLSQGTIWTPGRAGFVATYLGADVRVSDINNAGFAVGTRAEDPSDNFTATNAFFWQNGVFTILPETHPVSNATAMSDVNGNVVQVVGQSMPAPVGNTYNAVQRWEVTVTPLAPNWPTAQLSKAVNRFQIDGSLTARDGQSLLGKLDAATRHLEQGRPIPATNLINAVSTERKVLVGARRLAPQEAESLVGLAKSIVAGR